eukprot:TRINITY_DN48790_c0_g1_i2.p1 TRINITY_DN48790_c0_g1~~TRINITY_DN48790_c0_g1_i2.p1  ORF type:complete len:846 (-),score=226.05 TRINITY_DN48790_c0_g1_i2:130-2667(-)
MNERILQNCVRESERRLYELKAGNTGAFQSKFSKSDFWKDDFKVEEENKEDNTFNISKSDGHQTYVWRNGKIIKSSGNSNGNDRAGSALDAFIDKHVVGGLPLLRFCPSSETLQQEDIKMYNKEVNDEQDTKMEANEKTIQRELLKIRFKKREMPTYSKDFQKMKDELHSDIYKKLLTRDSSIETRYKTLYRHFDPDAEAGKSNQYYDMQNMRLNEEKLRLQVLLKSHEVIREAIFLAIKFKDVLDPIEKKLVKMLRLIVEEDVTFNVKVFRKLMFQFTIHELNASLNIQLLLCSLAKGVGWEVPNMVSWMSKELSLGSPLSSSLVPKDLNADEILGSDSETEEEEEEEDGETLLSATNSSTMSGIKKKKPRAKVMFSDEKDLLVENEDEKEAINHAIGLDFPRATTPPKPPRRPRSRLSLQLGGLKSNTIITGYPPKTNSARSKSSFSARGAFPRTNNNVGVLHSARGRMQGKVPFATPEPHSPIESKRPTYSNDNIQKPLSKYHQNRSNNNNKKQNSPFRRRKYQSLSESYAHWSNVLADGERSQSAFGNTNPTTSDNSMGPEPHIPTLTFNSTTLSTWNNALTETNNKNLSSREIPSVLPMGGRRNRLIAKKVSAVDTMREKKNNVTFADTNMQLPLELPQANFITQRNRRAESNNLNSTQNLIPKRPQTTQSAFSGKSTRSNRSSRLGVKLNFPIQDLDRLAKYVEIREERAKKRKEEEEAKVQKLVGDKADASSVFQQLNSANERRKRISNLRSRKDTYGRNMSVVPSTSRSNSIMGSSTVSSNRSGNKNNDTNVAQTPGSRLFAELKLLESRTNERERGFRTTNGSSSVRTKRSSGYRY